MVEGMLDNDGVTIPDAQAVAFVKERLSRPDVLATGVAVRFQRTILRFAPDAEARLERAYAFVDANRGLWVGINMAGIEENGLGYPSRFLDTFRRMRSRIHIRRSRSRFTPGRWTGRTGTSATRSSSGRRGSSGNGVNS